MDVRDLEAIIKNLPDNTPVFVCCEGYSNYDFKENKQFDDQDTRLLIYDGKLFIIDSCDYGNERR